MLPAKYYLWAAVVGIFAACDPDINHPATQHDGCGYHFNSAWNQAELVLYHNDTRDCPTGIPFGELAFTSGTIVDTDAMYNEVESHNASWANLDIWDDWVAGTFPSGWGSWWLAGTTESFYWDLAIHDQNKDFEWQAYVQANFNRSFTPDYGHFWILWQDVTLPTGEALMTIHYNGDEM